MRLLILAAVVAPLLTTLCGCVTKSPPVPGTMTKAPYSDAFVSRRYAEAYDKASAAAQEAEPGRAHDEAALVAGLSATQIDRTDDARRWLEPLTRSQERDIAGRAGAALGLMEQERGRHADAAPLLREASEKLTDDEAANAAYQAGQSYDALGQRDLARAQYASAAAIANDPLLKKKAQQRVSGAPAGAQSDDGPFAIQLGAFAKIDNAQECVRNNTPASTRLGLGLPRIGQRIDDGRKLFVVYVGRFPTKEAATGSRKSFSSASVVDTRSN